MIKTARKLVCFLFIFSFILPAFARDLPKIDEFLTILARVESSNNQKAYKKDENAIGIYQIRADYFKDAQDYDKDLIKYKHSDCYSPEISKKVVKAYILRYSNNKIDSFETWAKMHNGGGRYWLNKNKNYQKNLDKYWKKFLAKSGN